MKRHLKPTIALLFLASVSLHAAPDHHYKELNRGSSDLRLVEDICQDGKGLIWFASMNGVYRYDGTNLRRYTASGTMSSERAIQIEADGDIIWGIDEYYKLYRYNSGEELFKPVDTHGRPIAQVYPSGGEGYTYFKTGDGRLYSYMDDEVQEVPLPADAVVNDIFRRSDGKTFFLLSGGLMTETRVTLFADAAYCAAEYQGYSYFGSGWGRLYRYNDRELTTIYLGSFSHVTSICGIPGTDEILACTNRDGCFIYDTVRKTARRVPTATYMSGEKRACSDIHSNVWVYSLQGGLDWYNKEKHTLEPFYGSESSPEWDSENHITAVYPDRQGNLWISSSMSGVQEVVFNTERFSFRPVTSENDFSAANSVRASMEDSDGNYWMCTKDRTVHVFDHDFRLIGHLKPDGSISRDAPEPVGFAYCITQTHDGTIWLACKGEGLLELTPAGKDVRQGFRIRSYTRDSNNFYGIPSDQLYSLYEDEGRRLWIASFDEGLSYLDLDDANRQFISQRNRLPFPTSDRNRLRYVTKGPDGRIIVSGRLGLFILRSSEADPEDMHFWHITGFENDSFISDDIQYFSYVDSTVYVCSFGSGLFLVNPSDGSKRERITMDDGLLSNFLLSSIYDGKGNLWIASEGGLNKYNIESGSLVSYPYDRIGFMSHFNEGSPFLASDGRIYFNSNKGLMYFDPDEMSGSQYAPHIVVLSCIKEGGKAAVDLSREIATGRRIVMRDREQLSIDLAAADMTDASNITYRYMLEGLDNSWTNNRSHTITLKDLRSGNYILRIRSTNGDGVFTDNEISFPLTVRWSGLRTLLLSLAGAMAVAAIILLAVRYRRKKNLQQEADGAPDRKDIYLAGLNEADREFGGKMLDFIDSRLDDRDLDIPLIASHMNMSRSVMYKRTKAIFGKTPVDLIHEARFNKACELLDSGRYLIAQVADMTGFNDPQYFCKAFKRACGMTPSEYRKKGKAGE